MATIKMTREQYQQKYGSLPEIKPKKMAQNMGILTEGDPIRDLGIGFGKRILSTLQNVGNIIAKPLGSKMGVPESEIGISEQKLAPTSDAQKAGGVVADIASIAVPSSRIAGVLPRVLTTAGVVSAQEGEIGKEAAVAAGTELALPVVGKYVTKPIFNIATRLTKSLASKLAGVSSKNLDEILANPEVAKNVSAQIDKSGQREVLTKNVETVLQGVRTIKQEARSAYGRGLEALKKADISPKTFRDNTQQFLDNYGFVIENGKRNLKNVEFTDPKNIEKAKDLVNKLNTVDLDGVSLRKFADDIESSRFKIATSDERLSFNAFLNDLSGTLRDAIKQSTDKLDEINVKFSKDMQLAQAVEDIFGKVKFGGNLSEIRKASEKMERLFAQKGLTPDIVDDFLRRINVEPSVLRTREAVRQISESVSPKNAEGITISELTSGLTGAVIPPNKVRDIAIKIGLAENTIKSVLEKVAPSARATLIKMLAGLTD